MWSRPVAFVNASVVAEGGIATSVRFSSWILDVDRPPRRGDTVVDLGGAIVLPGLVNAHDHLELNHYGRIKFRERYENASEWIDDMRPRLATDAAIRAARSHPLAARLFIGGLKNLLAGVTTLAHHNPFYRELDRAVPIRVVRRYGWAHSFFLEQQEAGARGEPGGDVARRWRSTPADAPFFVHLAEGIDGRARGELARFEALGCLAPNAVLVHGVGIDADGWRRVAERGAGLVWCPASNQFLFGRTAAVRQMLDIDGGRRRRVALGTDSRLTGARDLLDELRAARVAMRVSAAELLAMVTSDAASILRLGQSGRLAPGLPADLVVVPRAADEIAESLLATVRRRVQLVVVGGRPLVGDAGLASVFQGRGATPRPLVVDGGSKIADAALVRQIAACPIAEPGVGVE